MQERLIPDIRDIQEREMHFLPPSLCKKDTKRATSVDKPPCEINLLSISGYIVDIAQNPHKLTVALEDAEELFKRRYENTLGEIDIEKKYIEIGDHFMTIKNMLTNKAQKKEGKRQAVYLIKVASAFCQPAIEITQTPREVPIFIYP